MDHGFSYNFQFDLLGIVSLDMLWVFPRGPISCDPEDCVSAQDEAMNAMASSPNAAAVLLIKVFIILFGYYDSGGWYLLLDSIEI